MEKKTFTENIRRLRKKAQYTQEEVSQKLNIQRQTYCNYENASRTPPIEIILALAELYHVSVDSLITGRDCSKPESGAAPSSKLEKRLLHDFSTLSEPKQREVLEFIRFKKSLPD